MSEHTEPDVGRIWQEFWLPLVMRENGTIDMAQIKRELFDYHNFMDEVSRAYDEITGGRISKPNTHAHHVIAEATKHLDTGPDYEGLVRAVGEFYEMEPGDARVQQVQRILGEYEALLKEGLV